MENRIKEIHRKKKETESFFKEAFCAESAEIVLNAEELNLKPGAIVKVKSKDRGTFYIAHMVTA